MGEQEDHPGGVLAGRGRELACWAHAPGAVGWRGGLQRALAAARGYGKGASSCSVPTFALGG